MSEDLHSRINAMDLKHPYVWKLRISSAEFDDLEESIRTGTATALQNVVYLAEWYKRRYDGGSAKPVVEFDSKMLRKCIEESGIDKKNNLFQTESGNKAWQYSIYVLGGVAIPFELGKTSKKFLKELCKIYYGEDGDVDQLGVEDKARAIAFKESVRTRGSLYEYLKAVLSGDPPFAADDLADKASPENQFIERIKSANDEVLKSKFDLEWMIGFEPDREYVTRKLRLILKPESLGGLNHQYLKSERVALWGIDPDKCKRIVVGVRFLLESGGRGATALPVGGGCEAIALPVSWLLEYSATGSREAGFVAWYTERHSKKIDVPTERFNVVEIVARDDQGKEHSVEKFPVEEWMQVFRVPGGYNEWTSLHCAQRDSAVICPESFEMLDVGATETVYKKRFWCGGLGATALPSEVYQWRRVYDTVRFKNGAGEVITIFNRQGYDQILTRLHSDILRYQDGCVNYVVDRDDEYEESLLPLVFGRDDLIVRHFESCNDMEDAPSSEGDYEKVEFKVGGAYREWTDDDYPARGQTTLRITVKGVPRKLSVYYLPIKIERDCDNGKIVCGEEVIADKVVRDGTPSAPVVHKSLGTDEEFVSLEIWRATKHKEMIRDGHVVKYVEDGEDVEISYALKDGLIIHDFSVSGYREYDCGDISGIYSLDEFSPVGDHHLDAILNQKKRVRVSVSAKLDSCAPEWLWVNLAGGTSGSDSAKMYYWNYRPGTVPKEVGEDAVCQENEIIFHSLKDYDGLCVRPPKIGEPDPFASAEDEETPDLVDYFEVATEHRLYYFMMLPFGQPNVDLLNDLYNPLVTRRGGQLTEEDRKGLARLAEEFGFDWREKYGISI